MAFDITPQDLKKAQKCPPGMHIFTLVEVEEPYLKENGNEVQKADFESDKGHVVPTWFNSSFKANLIEFIQAADNIILTDEMLRTLPPVDLKNYIGKKVAASVSHRRDNNNKVQAQIDNFFSADKVPF